MPTLRCALGRRLHIWIPLAVLLAATALRVTDPWFLVQARHIAFDSLNRLAPRPFDAGAPVRVVDIDEESLARFGQWPWPRTRMAELVARLAGMEAATIAFDIVFAEPDRTSPAAVVRAWPEAPASLRAGLSHLPDHDAVFADAIGGAPVVTGFVLSDSGYERPPRAKAGFAFAGDDPMQFVPGFSRAVASLPELELAAAGNGALTSLPDPDGMIRRAPLLLRMGGTLFPTLGLEALRVAQGAQTGVVRASGGHQAESFGQHTGISQVKMGEFVLPTDERGRVWLWYAGPRPERYVPAWRLFESDFDPGEIAGRIVFVGTSAAGLKDLRATPLHPAVPGVELYAELLEQAFAGTFLERPDFAVGLEIVYVLAIGALLIVLLPRAGARWGGLLGLAAVALAIFASWHAYTNWHWLLDPVYPALVVAVVYMVETALIFFATESERRWVRGAFGRYLSPAVVERLASHPERLALGGEMREMTVLFSDIRNFTARAEKLDAASLTRFINRYLTPMTEAVLGQQGTVDKYIGDAVMAFWNAPLDDSDHARHACRAALAMRAALSRLNAQWAAETPGFEAVRIGIGLNTGLCCVGNLGSDQRFDYSVMGDDVNLASRLEGQCKAYGLDIVLSEATQEKAPNLAAVEIDLLRVKGRAAPVRIYALLGDETVAASPDFAALAEAQARFLAAYRAGRWDEAEGVLAECRINGPDLLMDLYAIYAARLAAFRAQPPLPGWGGVFDAAEK